VSDFDRFFKAHSPGIWSYLVRLAGDPDRAADLFQRVVLKAYTHFEERRASGAERAWVYTIATNEARDEIRRRKRDPLRPMELPEAWTRPEEDPSVAAQDRELAREVLRGIEELPHHQRELFLLVRYHGFGFSEAAFLCGLSLSAAKMSVARAHEKLLRRLAGRIDLRSLFL
jgi:RNA polymerase sigma-70 factor (ECF subfamily)